MNLNLKRAVGFVTVASAALLAPLASNAATINMIVGNLDVQFNGDPLNTTNGELHETTDPDTGPLDPGEAQRVSTTEFELDGATTASGVLMEPTDFLYVDLYVPNLGTNLQFDSLETLAGGPGTLDWFVTDGAVAPTVTSSLQLTFDSISYVASEAAGIFQFFGTATVASQSNLPDGLIYGDEVSFAYSASDAMFLQNGNMMLASGALTITGEQIPEPASLALCGLAATCLLAYRRRR